MSKAGVETLWFCIRENWKHIAREQRGLRLLQTMCLELEEDSISMRVAQDDGRLEAHCQRAERSAAPADGVPKAELRLGLDSCASVSGKPGSTSPECREVCGSCRHCVSCWIDVMSGSAKGIYRYLRSLHLRLRRTPMHAAQWDLLPAVVAPTYCRRLFGVIVVAPPET